MTVVDLAHVKESSPPPVMLPSSSSNFKRTAWPGGKLTSNKSEALEKFIKRKQAMGALSEEQLEVLMHHQRNTIETATKTPLTNQADASNDTIRKTALNRRNPEEAFYINGRLVGAKPTVKFSRKLGPKASKKRRRNKPMKTTSLYSSSKLDLQSKLDMSLDDLINK